MFEIPVKLVLTKVIVWQKKSSTKSQIPRKAPGRWKEGLNILQTVACILPLSLLHRWRTSSDHKKANKNKQFERRLSRGYVRSGGASVQNIFLAAPSDSNVCVIKNTCRFFGSISVSAADYVYTADEFRSSLLQRHQPEGVPPLLSRSNARLMPVSQTQSGCSHSSTFTICLQWRLRPCSHLEMRKRRKAWWGGALLRSRVAEQPQTRRINKYFHLTLPLQH